MLAVHANPVLQFLRQLRVAGGTAHLPDRDLLQRFVRQRDETAFAALVQRHGPIVLRVCLQVLHQEQNAEDAFQATFLILSRKAASLRKRDSLASWLYGVAHHAAMDLKRTIDRRRCRENLARPPSQTDPLAALTVREGQEILHQELSRLPEKYRAPLVLCCLEGLARDEAARQLAWPLGKLKYRLEQARKLLSARLLRRGFTLSAALATSALSERGASAALPTRLVNLTVEAAKLVVPGGASSSVVSASVATLTEGVLSAMTLSKLNSAMVLLLAALITIVAVVQVCPRQVAVAGDADSTNASPAGLITTAPPTLQQHKPIPADQEFLFGQVVRPRFFLRNTGKTPIEVSYPRLITQHYYRSLHFLDKEGGQLPVRKKDEPGFPVGWLAVQLPAGEYAEISGNLLSIGEGADKDSAETVLPARPRRTYRVQYTLPDYSDSKAGDLETGEFRFRVLDKGAREPKQPSPKERKREIAWGKPGKNGLQVGVLLEPVEKADGDAKQ
jgi:RNA polymerase sigma factor (sigma-70 family)